MRWMTEKRTTKIQRLKVGLVAAFDLNFKRHAYLDSSLVLSKSCYPHFQSPLLDLQERKAAIVDELFKRRPDEKPVYCRL